LIGNHSYDKNRLEWLSRLVNTVEILKQNKQDRLLKREMTWNSCKKSILFLYPVVITTYDQIYWPRFDCLLETVHAHKIVVRPEYN
jgi:hypothetical protein